MSENILVSGFHFEEKQQADGFCVAFVSCSLSNYLVLLCLLTITIACI